MSKFILIYLDVDGEWSVSGKCFPKSSTWVIYSGELFSLILILMVSLEIKKLFSLVSYFLTIAPYNKGMSYFWWIFLSVQVNQSPPFCGSLIPFFLFQASWQSLHLVNLTITVILFWLTWCHVSIWSVSMLQPSLSNIPTTLCSSVSSFTSLVIPTISRHSLLQYWTFVQHWQSMSTSLLQSRLLTFLEIHASDWSLSNLSCNLRISSGSSVLELLASSSLSCKDKTIRIKSFLYSLSNDSFSCDFWLKNTNEKLNIITGC